MTNSDDPVSSGAIGVVAIGRNEGERLIACLKSAIGPGRRVVYVDSGSTDGSVKAATALGAEIVALDMSAPFTAARARNAGAARLIDHGPPPPVIQFVDGDCEIVAGWFDIATQFLSANRETAAVCGRRREKHPDTTLFNRLVDREWATPVGEADACGGDVMIRTSAFQEIDGYDAALIAGEEPEMCVRLRAAGWRIMRLDAEMTRHDIDMNNLGQWLKRARRAGHAYGEVSMMHKNSAHGIWRTETRRALTWTGLIAAILLSGFFSPWLWIGLLIVPMQIVRIAVRDGARDVDCWAYAALIMLQKPWEAAGIIQYWLSRASGRRAQLIEYRKS